MGWLRRWFRRWLENWNRPTNERVQPIAQENSRRPSLDEQVRNESEHSVTIEIDF